MGGRGSSSIPFISAAEAQQLSRIQARGALHISRQNPKGTILSQDPSSGMAGPGTPTVERENPSHCPTACSGCFLTLPTLSAAPKKDSWGWPRLPSPSPEPAWIPGVPAGQGDGLQGWREGSRRGELINSKQS